MISNNNADINGIHYHHDNDDYEDYYYNYNDYNNNGEESSPISPVLGRGNHNRFGGPGQRRSSLLLRSWNDVDNNEAVDPGPGPGPAAGSENNDRRQRRDEQIAAMDPDAQTRRQRRRERRAAGRERERELERQVEIDREREMFDPMLPAQRQTQIKPMARSQAQFRPQSVGQQRHNASRDSTNSMAHLLSFQRGGGDDAGESDEERGPPPPAYDDDDDDGERSFEMGDDEAAAAQVHDTRSYDTQRQQLPKPIPLFSDVGDNSDLYDEFGFYSGGGAGGMMHDGQHQDREASDDYGDIAKTPVETTTPLALSSRSGNKVRIVSGRRLEEARIRHRGGGGAGGGRRGGGGNNGSSTNKEGYWIDDGPGGIGQKPVWKKKRWIALIVLIILLVIIIPVAAVVPNKNHHASSSGDSSTTNRPPPNRPLGVQSPYNANLNGLDPNSIPV